MRLLCNSIPKSGTYLLSAIADYCGLKDENLRFVEGGVNVVDDRNNLVRFDADASPNRLGRMSDGTYAPCHLAHSDALASFLRSNNIKHLFIYRHPADVIYSYVRFVAYSRSFRDQSADNEQFQNRLLNDFQSDEDRFNYVFRQYRSAFNFETSTAWLNSDAAYAIRFEELYEEILMLEQGQIGRVTSGMFRYLGISSSSNPRASFSAIYGVGPTFMDGKNKVGQYRQLDAEKIAPSINDPTFVTWLKLYGYSM